MSTGTRPAGYSSAAVGWAAFAGIMLTMHGVIDVIQGIAALVNNEFFVITEEYVFEFNVTTWGWIHLIGGIIPGIVCATVCYYLTVPLIRAYQHRRKGVIKAKLAAIKLKAAEKKAAKADGQQKAD